MTTLPHDHLPLSDNTQHSSPAPSHPYQPEKLGSRKRYPTEPNRPLNPFPSPPLSAPTHEDPWRPMSEPPSTRGYTWQVEDMEGSWRKEVAGKGKEVLWDANDHEPVPGLGELPNPRQRIERERDSLERDLLARGPLPIAVWAKVMDSSKGRDKVLKCAQYSLRTYLYLLRLISAVRPLSPWFNANSKRMRVSVSGLSLTRKCLRLLNPLHPLTHLLSPTPTSAPTLIRHLIDLASALSDDIYCLSRLGVVGRRTGRIADRWANRFWFLTTILALYSLHLQTIPRLKENRHEQIAPSANEVIDPRPPTRKLGSKSKELRIAQWTNYKLLSDLIFVSYDVMELSWFKEPVQCATGLVSAFISTRTLYDQHWVASLGKG